MVLAQYSDLFWFPSGVLAAGVAARVFPIDSNVLAPLWADAGGTIPLPNPTVTDAGGNLTFWAETGAYWLHLDSETFQIAVGAPPDLNVAEIAAATISTGITAGGALAVNAGDPAALDIAPLTGYVTDMISDPFNPTITRVVYPGGTVAMDAGSLARTATAWLMDENQVITQQATAPTNSQRRTHIFLGATAQVGGIIIVDQSLPDILQQPANQFSDLLSALGAFSITGNRITPNGVNLQINQAAGRLWSQAFNHFAGAVQTNDPHVSTTTAQTPASFRYTTRSSLVFGPLTSNIDVANYDVGGVITPVGGGANSSTIHRIYMFPNNSPTEQIVIQYGQTVYSSLANAVAAIGAGTFVPHPLLLEAGALVAYVAATRTATDLSNTAQAIIVTAGKFATP